MLDKNLKTKLILSVNGRNSFFKDLYSLDLSTGTESYEFSTTAGNIEESDYIMFRYQGEYKLFQIIDIEQEHREGKIVTSVYGESACLELLNSVVRPMENSVSMSAIDFIKYVLHGTGWQLKRHSSSLNSKKIDIKIDRTTQIWTVIQDYMQEFGYEIEARVKYDNGHVKEKYIDVYAEGELGNKTYKKFEYGRNVKGIVKKKHLYDFCTALIIESSQDIINVQYGEENGNTLKPKSGLLKKPSSDVVLAVDNNNKYNLGRDYIYGVYEDHDSNSSTEAVGKALKELVKRSVPKFDYECDTAITYEEYEKISLGDTVRVIDHSFNPIISLEARIGKLEISFTDRNNCSCTITNYKDTKDNTKIDLRAIKDLLDKVIIQPEDKDKGQEEITLKDDYLEFKDDYLEDKEKLEDKLDELENKLNEHIENDDSCDCDGNGGNNSDLEDKLNKHIDECNCDELNDKYNDLDKKYDDLDGKYNDLNGKYNDLDGKYNDLSDDLEAHKRESSGRFSSIESNYSSLSSTVTAHINNTSIHGGGSGSNPGAQIGDELTLKKLIIDREGANNTSSLHDGYITYSPYDDGLEISSDGYIDFYLGKTKYMALEDKYVNIGTDAGNAVLGLNLSDKNIKIPNGKIAGGMVKNANDEYELKYFTIEYAKFKSCDITGLTGELSEQSEYTALLAECEPDENKTHINMSYDSDEVRWCWKETVFTYAESDIDPETDQWVYTGRYVCYVELPIFMAENIENNYHINVSKMSWGDYRIIEKTPYYFILESQEDNFAFTFEVVAKLVKDYDNNNED